MLPLDVNSHKMSTSIESSVRVLLQSLPAASPALGSANNNNLINSNNNNNVNNNNSSSNINNLQQNDTTTPVKFGASATPLRARNAQQQQQQQFQYTQQAQQQLFFGTPEKSSTQGISTSGGKLRAPEEFWRDLHQFHERRGTPLTQAAKISGQQVDLYRLYQEVTERGGFNKVNMRDEWDEVYSALDTLRERCVNGTAGIKHIYRRYLDKYERLNFFGEDPDKLEALEAAIECAELGASASRARSRALASVGAGGGGSGLTGSGLGSIFGHVHSTLTAVPVAYICKLCTGALRWMVV